MKDDELAKALRDMYDLGYKHGYSIALKEAKLEKLTKELEDLK